MFVLLIYSFMCCSNGKQGRERLAAESCGLSLAGQLAESPASVTGLQGISGVAQTRSPRKRLRRETLKRASATEGINGLADASA